MPLSYGANAVLGKAHAMYAKRLTKQNYNDLVNCRSLSELVNYLKTRTNYASNFENVPVNITSAQIEELLRVSVLNKSEQFCSYELSLGQGFYEYFIVQTNNKQILNFIRLLILGKPEKYLSALPAFFDKHTDINLYALATVKSYRELLEVVKNTPYYKILSPYSETYKKHGEYIKIESDLNKYLRDCMVKTISHSGKKDKSELFNLAKYKFDMENIICIYRLKRLQDADSNYIKSFIQTELTNFSSKEIDMLVNAPQAREMLRLIPNTFYKRDFARVEFDYLEGAMRKMQFDYFYKCFRYSTSPTAVMFSYIFLVENEIHNIIHIVEGIKYKISPEKISAALIGTDK